jgi:hypothetical protein
MPAAPDPDPEGGAPRLSLRRRVFTPRTRDREKVPIGDRLRGVVLRPVDPDAAPTGEPAGEPLSVEQLEAAVKSANDKERLVGLLAAPFAAAIGILVVSALIVNDAPARLKDGQVDTLHVSVSLYHDLAGVLIALSILMLAMAMLRKRLYLAIVMALYGLAVFNLHYWGFGVPFIMGGAWLMVRAYRLQRNLRGVTGDNPARSGPGRRGGGGGTGISRPQPNKRYTPPSPAARRSASPRAGHKQSAS